MTPIIKELVSVSTRSPAVLHIDISPQMRLIVARNLCKQKAKDSLSRFTASDLFIYLVRVVTLHNYIASNSGSYGSYLELHHLPSFGELRESVVKELLEVLVPLSLIVLQKETMIVQDPAIKCVYGKGCHHIQCFFQ